MNEPPVPQMVLGLLRTGGRLKLQLRTCVGMFIGLWVNIKYMQILCQT
jgi:hypothetical protein